MKQKKFLVWGILNLVLPFPVMGIIKMKGDSFAIACIVMSSIAILLHAAGWISVLYIGSQV